MLFLPTSMNFVAFNRNYYGTSTAYNGISHTFPTGYSVSIKHTKLKKFSLNSTITEPIILVELTPIGFKMLFDEDASILRKGYYKISNKTIEKYFSKLYKHEAIEDEIKYLNNSFFNMLTVNKSHVNNLNIEHILYSIEHKHRFEVSVMDLVKEFNCSRSTLEREFNKFVGFSPKVYITRNKICHTFLEFINNDFKLNEIEYLYNNYSHINLMFHTILGASPKIFAQDLKHNNLKIYQLQVIS